MTFEGKSPSIKIDICNSKFELLKKDAQRLVKIAASTDFKTILESKVDINFKIAKLIANAINWKLDFSSVTGSKYTIIFPA